MGESAAAPAGTRPPEPDSDVPESERLDELRSIIIGPEHRRLRALEARLDDPSAQAREVSQILPQAILLRAHDPQLTTALRPSIEEAITASVRRNPKPLADALFPVIGPAIRRAIAHTLTAMVQSLNQTLEHSLSWQAIGWRVTALRTGKSFAEIVLLHTLVFRVEQVFLIERKSGLLLQHLSTSSGAVDEVDMVSGMLTAIRDFVQDSFKVDADEALETLQVGNLSVWIEQGPHAILAAVIRGNAPRELRTTLADALDAVHLQFADQLESFSGDTTPFEATRSILEALLQAQYRTEKKSRASRLKWAAIAVGVAAAGALVWWGRDRARWNRYVERLRAQPGIVVVSEGREGGRRVVTGLRDPLSADPTRILAESGLDPADVTSRWDLYQSLDPRFALARARQFLNPPDGVQLTFADGVLSASGASTAQWIRDGRRLASTFPGITRFEDKTALDDSIRATVGRIQQAALHFVRGTSRILPGDDAKVRSLAIDVGELNDLCALGDIRYAIQIIGHTDSDGPPGTNLPLSRARAETVAAALGLSRLAFIELSPSGVGSDDPSTTGMAETDKQENRRVVFRAQRINGQRVTVAR
jgi:outer membrane protein OmpA-like peptidoglycan-associated protein